MILNWINKYGIYAAVIILFTACDSGDAMVKHLGSAMVKKSTTTEKQSNAVKPVNSAGLPPVAADQNSINFLLTADIQYCTENSQWRNYAASLANLQKIAEFAAENRMKAWLDLGDLIEDNSITAAEDANFKLLDDILHGVPDITIYHVAGNNDQKAAKRLHNNCGWENLFYTFSLPELSDWQFIVLNTSETGREDVSDGQLEWLADELTDSRAAGKKVMIFSHVPLSYMTADFAALSELIAANPQIQGNISGHTHLGGSRMVSGIPQIELKAVLENSKTPTFAILKISADSWEIVGYGNQPSYIFKLK